MGGFEHHGKALRRGGGRCVYCRGDLRASYMTAIAHLASGAARNAIDRMGRRPTQSPDAESRSPKLRRLE